MRIILFTGKGGVGKTTISAATGLICSELGYKTIVMSTDPAHSLADSFDLALQDKPLKIKQNLYGQEINVQKKIEENWSSAKKYISALLSSQNIDELVAEEMAVMPGMDELFSLIEIKNYYEQKSYDVLIVDCAPTGATLRLLSLPDIAAWYMRKIFPIERKVMKVMKKVASRFIPVPLPEDDVYEDFKNVYDKVGVVKDILSDDRTTSVRLVINPEKMVIKEAQRAYTYLNLFAFPVDCAITNKVIPDEVEDLYFKEWKETQKEYLKLIEDAFSPLPLFQCKLHKREIVGLEGLRIIGEDIYQNNDPTKVFYQDKAIEIKKTGKEDYSIILKLPFMTKKDVSLNLNGDELIVKVGWFKRNILLPDTFLGLSPKGAKFIEDDLVIKFGR